MRLGLGHKVPHQILQALVQKYKVFLKSLVRIAINSQTSFSIFYIMAQKSVRLKSKNKKAK